MRRAPAPGYPIRLGIEPQGCGGMTAGPGDSITGHAHRPQPADEDLGRAVDDALLAMAYGLCTELGILAMGITAGRAMAYELGAMNFVVPVGSRFGDESEVFVGLCDEFLVLGGGPQSLAEAEAGLAQGKPVRVITGFGGAADALAMREDLPQLLRIPG